MTPGRAFSVATVAVELVNDVVVSGGVLGKRRHAAG